ncbi:Homocysteine S-methyltransferase family protein [Balamuthia mandrillaris]
MAETREKKDLLAALQKEPVICAEGYLFELERRGYVRAGAFVPEVLLDHPEVVEALHLDFVRSGSDVVEAFTYYAHRERLGAVGLSETVEEINRRALRIAKKVATETNTFVAGNICNTNVYVPSEEKRVESGEKARAMFREQIQWAVEEGVDFIIAETLDYVGEALIALEEIKRAGLTAVVTLSCHSEERTWDNVDIVDACLQLEKAGADVIGLNCHRGPKTMLPILERLSKALTVPIAALPVPFRTTEEEPTMQKLTDPTLPTESKKAFPIALDPFVCNRFEIAEFTKAAQQLGVKYFGLCCGAQPHHVRSMALALGKTPAAAKYSPDMSKHFILGSGESTTEANRSHAGQL